MEPYEVTRFETEKLRDRPASMLDSRLEFFVGRLELLAAKLVLFLGYALAITMVPAFALLAVFKTAGYAVRRNPKTYRDHPLDDGTARYDDVWGG